MARTPAATPGFRCTTLIESTNNVSSQSSQCSHTRHTNTAFTQEAVNSSMLYESIRHTSTQSSVFRKHTTQHRVTTQQAPGSLHVDVKWVDTVTQPPHWSSWCLQASRRCNNKRMRSSILNAPVLNVDNVNTVALFKIRSNNTVAQHVWWIYISLQYIYQTISSPGIRRSQRSYLQSQRRYI